MYYASFGVLAIILHIIINYEVLFKNTNDKKTIITLRYKHFLISVLVFYLVDFLWGALYARRLTLLVYADTFMFFLSMVVSVLFWTRYVVSYLNKDNFFGLFLKGAGWLIFFYEIITLIVNFFAPVVFLFDSNKEYVPGYARYMTLAMQMILFALTSIYTLVIAVKSEGKSKIHHGTIGFSGFVMTLFIFLQTLYPLLPFYSIGCLIATSLVHTFVEEDEKIDYNRELGTAMQMAYTDSLTNVKNVHAYVDAKKTLDRRITDGNVEEFGVIVFDLNGLKKINDTLGHEEGDRYIKQACEIICNQFKHSPVYRIGGDEFVALLEGDDYREINKLTEAFEKLAERNQKLGLVVVSDGLAEYNPKEDGDFDAVFERADHNMYKRKKALKAMEA